ncbi:MAG: SusC/RagA family TonB-linked outer membrane protein [Gemmatimonadetes bacterium]|nr:SusC/RagA family TonB-linked outer membrane protein [Gemmatimonadota bacterium]
MAGRVVDAATLQPLSGAQLVIEGSTSGGLTGTQGRYLIQNLPPGTHTLRVVLIGYGPVSREFSAQPGETAVVDFSLGRSALELDAIVVTVTGEQRKRELGNAVATVAADQVVGAAPIRNLADLLQGRAAGVQLLNSSGVPGAGSRIRVRGASSIALSNTPLVYVDGIRVNSRASEFWQAVGQDASRIEDFNPEDIESIEIVKGPAASTLYGTEAANGVIRITTKQGLPGPPRWSAWVESGLVQDPNDYPLNYAGLSNDAPFESECLLEYVDLGLCSQTGIESYQVLNDPALSPTDTGSRSQIGLSVQGGSERVNYYIAGEIEDETGPFSLPMPDRSDLERRGIPITDEVERPFQLERKNLRVNLNAQVADQATAAVRFSYLDSHTAFTANDNCLCGFMGSALIGGSNPGEAWGLQAPAQTFGRTLSQDVQRVTFGTSLNVRPQPWLELRGTGGVDYTNRVDVSFIARDLGVPGPDLGAKGTGFANTWQYTLDLGGTASFDLTQSVTSATTLGAQYFRHLFTGTDAEGFDLVNGASSVGVAAETSAFEYQDEDRTFGVFVDQLIGLNERLFLNVALRADDNSAFGRDFDLVFYPKAGVSWVASEEDFFPDWGFVDQFRVRGAWGESGLQPRSEDPLRTLNAEAITDPSDLTVSGVSIGNVGNALLEPERSSEIEVGVDADLFRGRLGVELTYYAKSTNGALVQQPLAPSLGSSATRWANIGEVENRGFEAAVSSVLVDGETVRWSVSASGSKNTNELITLGDDVDSFGGFFRFEPGYPLGGLWALPIQGFDDANGNGIISADEVTIGDELAFAGSGFPEENLTLSTNVTVFGGLTLFGLLDYRGDFVSLNFTEFFRCVNVGICRAAVDPTAPQEDQAAAIAGLPGPRSTLWGFMQPADFWSLREVALSYRFPESLAARIGSSSLSITLSGRNLATWTDYGGIHPELEGRGAEADFGTLEGFTVPPARYFTLRLNVGF